MSPNAGPACCTAPRCRATSGRSRSARSTALISPPAVGRCAAPGCVPRPPPPRSRGPPRPRGRASTAAFKRQDIGLERDAVDHADDVDHLLRIACGYPPWCSPRGPRSATGARRVGGAGHGPVGVSPHFSAFWCTVAVNCSRLGHGTLAGYPPARRYAPTGRRCRWQSGSCCRRSRRYCRAPCRQCRSGPARRHRSHASTRRSRRRARCPDAW